MNQEEVYREFVGWQAGEGIGDIPESFAHIGELSIMDAIDYYVSLRMVGKPCNYVNWHNGKDLNDCYDSAMILVRDRITKLLEG